MCNKLSAAKVVPSAYFLNRTWNLLPAEHYTTSWPFVRWDGWWCFSKLLHKTQVITLTLKLYPFWNEIDPAVLREYQEMLRLICHFEECPTNATSFAATPPRKRSYFISHPKIWLVVRLGSILPKCLFVSIILNLETFFGSACPRNHLRGIFIAWSSNFSCLKIQVP